MPQAIGWVDLGLGSFILGYGTATGFLWFGNIISPGFTDWLSSELGDAADDMANTFTMIGEAEFPTQGCGCSVTVEFDEMEEEPPKD